MSVGRVSLPGWSPRHSRPSQCSFSTSWEISANLYRRVLNGSRTWSYEHIITSLYVSIYVCTIGIYLYTAGLFELVSKDAKRFKPLKCTCACTCLFCLHIDRDRGAKTQRNTERERQRERKKERRQWIRLSYVFTVFDIVSNLHHQTVIIGLTCFR